KWGHIPAYLAGFRMHPLAKGSSWLEKYAAEGRLMDQRYPEYRSDSLGHRLGMAFYRTRQLVTGRHLVGKIHSSRWVGRSAEEVFGSWKVLNNISTK